MLNTHLHILHLEHRADRLPNLMLQLEQQRIEDYTIINGYYDKINTKKAITQGHKLIIELAKKQGMTSVNVAEDDIVFSSKGAYDYFLSQIPEDYDLFCGLIYHGQVNDEGRVLNGMSGTHTLYSVHERFYDFILEQPDDVHIDRHLGRYAFEKEYYVCSPMVCRQSGSYSDNLKKSMDYSPYLTDKVLYGCK